MQLLLGFALGGDCLHGFLNRLLVTQEGHGLDGLQVGVELVHDGDPRGQVQLHDGGVGHAWRDVNKTNASVRRVGGGLVKGAIYSGFIFETEEVLCRRGDWQ